MQALPPKLPDAPRLYDPANERDFREALTRYFQQQRTDSAVADPQQSASPIAGRLVKAIGGGVLGNTNVTEASGLLTVSESLRVTGATTLTTLAVTGASALAGTLQVAGAGTFLTTLGVTGAFTASSTLHAVGAATFDSTTLTTGLASFTTGVAIGANPASAGSLRFGSNQKARWRNAANTGDLDGIYYDGSDNLWLGDNNAASVQVLGGSGGVAFQISTGGGTKWFMQGTGTFDLMPWHNFPSNNNVQNIGADSQRLKSLFAGTSVVTPVVNTNAATNLLLQRNSVTQLTLAASAATFVGTVSATQYTSTIATGTAPLVVASTTLVTNLHADNSDKLGTIAAASYALLASPAFTGVPTAPTAAPGTNTTQLATTAFVTAAGGSFAPVGAPYVTLALDGTLTNERVLAVGSVLSLTDGGAGGNATLSTTGGTFGAGDYTFPGNLQVPASTGYFGDTAANFASVFTAGDSLWAKTRFRVVREANGGNFRLGRVNGTLGSPSKILATNPIAIFNAEGYDGTSQLTAGQLTWTATADWSATNRSTSAVLGVTLAATAGIANVTFWGDDGSMALGNALHAQTYDLYAANVRFGAQAISTVATGTAPFVVASTTLVANLHVAQADTSTTQSANNNSTSIATTAYVDRAGGGVTVSPADPTGTTSATAVMMGLGSTATITPARKTVVVFTVMGQMANNTLNDGATVQLRYGTGTAPTNGAAVTGTQGGNSQTSTALVANERSGFCIIARVTGLTLGTAYWFDVAVNRVTGGTATVTGCTLTAYEVY